MSVEVSEQAAPHPPALEQSWQVLRVAPGSPADQAGVMVGDLWQEFDGLSGDQWTPRVLESSSPQADYQFYRPSSGRWRSFSAPAPLGLEARPSRQWVRARFDPKAPALEMLWPLWEEGAWKELAECCHATLWPDLNLFQKLREKFLGGLPSPPRPYLALYGAALIELGKTAPGYQRLEQFRPALSSWTLDFHALLAYYQARQDSAQAESLLREAYLQYPCPRIAQALQAVSRQPLPSLTRWLGQASPLDYDLPDQFSQQRVNLSQALQAMTPQQVLLVVWLGPYRGNGPYDDLLRRYQGYYRLLKQRLGPIHVISESQDKPPDRSHWFQQEEEALRKGLPLHILWDPEGLTAEMLQPERSPSVLGLTRQGRVVYEGHALSPYELWEMLSRL